MSVSFHVEYNFVFRRGLCLSASSDEMNENTHLFLLPVQANIQSEIGYKRLREKKKNKENKN